ncbi:MAG: metallophosphoesterase [Pseudomonadota bacterium]
MAKLAHISDPHLPLGSAKLTELLNKRILGHQSWHRNRKRIHRPEILARLVEDMGSYDPDHIAVTGDLTNIGLPQEFIAARKWLMQLGPSDRVTVIPGNHDAYIEVDETVGTGQWAANMQGDYAVPGLEEEADFPFVRIRRNIAFIALSSSVPTPWFVAAGELGKSQLEALAAALPRLREQGYFRCVLVHHPPLPGQNTARKALRDAAEMTGVLQQHGAELVLHGHNHQNMHEPLKTATGTAHVFGVPSASAKATGHKPAAGWNLYEISREGGKWHCKATIRGYVASEGKFADKRSFDLSFD